MTERRQGLATLGGLRLVVGGLMAGVLALMAIALLVSPPDADLFALTRTRTLWLGVLLSLAVGSLALVVVLSRVLVERSAANARGGGLDDATLKADFASLTIVRCAVVEGVGLFGVTVYLVAGLGIALVLGGASLVGLLLLFPSRGRFEAFRERVTRPE